MAVDYTKVFTVVGNVVDKVNTYYAYISTFNTHKTEIEAILSAQSVVYLEDGWTDVYDTLKDDVSGWMDQLIERSSLVLTDEALIGANFSFGATPTLDAVWPLLLHDMFSNDKNVTASVMTVGAITYDTDNASVGKLATGLVLDGITPPISGGPAISDYNGLNSQLLPTSETLTFTCTSDSENGTTRGSETFEITGTGPQSGPYDPLGENAGNLGSITVVDNVASQYGTNLSFDTWASNVPTGWTVVSGVGATDFNEEPTETLTGTGSALISMTTGSFLLEQDLNVDTFQRLKTYWIGIWYRKETDVGTDPVGSISVIEGVSNDLASLTLEPTSTAWQLSYTQFAIPNEMTDLRLSLDVSLVGGDDNIIIDQIVIAPCEYLMGMSFAIFGGPNKFIIGDTAVLTISNNNAGVFQTYFRKAYRVQLPTDATPTISDALVT